MGLWVRMYSTEDVATAGRRTRRSLYVSYVVERVPVYGRLSTTRHRRSKEGRWALSEYKAAIKAILFIHLRKSRDSRGPMEWWRRIVNTLQIRECLFHGTHSSLELVYLARRSSKQQGCSKVKQKISHISYFT